MFLIQQVVVDPPSLCIKRILSFCKMYEQILQFHIWAIQIGRFIPRNHKDILKKVSARRARATAKEDGSKGGEKRTAQFKYKSCCTLFAKDLQNQRFRDSYVTYKISKNVLFFDNLELCDHLLAGQKIVTPLLWRHNLLVS